MADRVAAWGVFLSSIYCAVICTHCASLPNIVFVLTDDQDVFLGGEIPMAKTKKLVGDQGIRFNNMFVSSPLCCPSRSSIFTGNYIHNHNAINNSVNGNCSSYAWQAGPEKETFITKVKGQGYNTFFSGKYLNQYGFPTTGGVKHVPPGWDYWAGLVGNSVYYDYTLSVNGTAEKHGSNYKTDYLTDVIHRRGVEFLENQNADRPFFMMLSTPACHSPFTPAPQYSQNFSDIKAPKNGSYNVHGKDKHWLIRAAKTPMSEASINLTDYAFVNRWRTLLSVDDMVENVVNILQQKGLLDNTYIFFTGDNGFHLGQFSLPIDKRQLYEFDVRVPLMVRGPGIKPGQVREEIAMNIDFAPTFVELAGLPPPPEMDGMSLKNVLHANTNKSISFRDTFLVEHVGEYEDNVPGCPDLKSQDVYNCITNCVCEDSKNNSFGCLRSISSSASMKYCEMDDNEHFIEVYDLKKDPYELDNIVKTVDPKLVQKYSQLLSQLSLCRGPTCRKVIPHVYGD